VRILANELSAHTGKRVTLAGWVHAKRDLARVSFVVLRDRSGLAQIVLDEPLDLEPETVVEVEGEVVANAEAPAGVELQRPTIRVLSTPVERPPIELRRPELKERLPTILDHAPVALRHPRRRAPFQLAAAALAGYRAALDRLDFTEIQTPKIVASATESGANLFRVDYFGREAFLAQSPQFYKQIMVGVFERVYEIGPVFRAEPHDTARHLAEYVSLDAEVGFIEDHHEVMRFAREAVAGMAEATGGVEVPEEIPWIHFADTGVEDVDLAPADERRLGECARDEHGSDFLFVVGYPMAKRPFYTHPDLERPEYSKGFDLIFRGVEVITGGQRLHRYEDYVAALAARGESLDQYEGYLQAFRYGMPPHGGFAIGLERWVAQLVGARNVRETTLFPRDLHRLQP
jgi:nondiscriminating aspartyl-tRNA synthetase